MRHFIPIFAAILVAGSASAQVNDQPATPNDDKSVAARTSTAPDQLTKTEAEAPAKPQRTATPNNPSFTVFSPASVYRASQECYKDCRP